MFIDTELLKFSHKGERTQDTGGEVLDTSMDTSTAALKIYADISLVALDTSMDIPAAGLKMYADMSTDKPPCETFTTSYLN